MTDSIFNQLGDYIPSWVDNYINVPFRLYDCYNLLRKVYQERLDISLPDVSEEYLHAFDISNIAVLYLREMKTNFKKIKTPVFGSFAVYLIKGRQYHCGMVVNRQYMLHTQKILQNSCLELYDGLEWKPKRVGYYNYVGT